MQVEEAAPLVQWVISKGLEGASETTLLASLCGRLVAAGVPLLRANISQPTLHPVIGGYLFIWQREAGEAIQEDWQRNVVAAGPEYLRTPFPHMIENDIKRFHCRLFAGEGCEDFPMLDRFRQSGGSDYLAFLSDFGTAQSLGPARTILTSWLTDAPGGFEEAHLAVLDQLAPALALAIRGNSTYRVASSVIETYLGRDAASRILQGTIERGAGETIRAALWYSDLQGFTKISDREPRDRLLGLLHDYFECKVTTIHEMGGEVLKFMGDGLLAMFNLGDEVASCCAALEAADCLADRMAEVSATRQREGLPVTRYSLGLHLGDVLFGNIGARDRLDFTVVGPAVNEASRIETMCRALDQQLVISSAFAQVARGGREAASDRIVSLGRYVLRGVRRPQELFTLVRPEDNV